MYVTISPIALLTNPVSEFNKRISSFSLKLIIVCLFALVNFKLLLFLIITTTGKFSSTVYTVYQYNHYHHHQVL